MVTLFLFERELRQLKDEYQSSANKIIKSQILNDIALLTAAIKELKESRDTNGSMPSTWRE
ncbi:hypothetical protein [Mesobacillus jeotgali]|uniref:hypothetical protein n=1 Tax=Mesobacillus jeotgali TaxID=129985 RepID=UPI0009A760A2|nr:hypothetical protein [Mesobacillus jeotgali]